jgi:hypothetical protein
VESGNESADDAVEHVGTEGAVWRMVGCGRGDRELELDATSAGLGNVCAGGEKIAEGLHEEMPELDDSAVCGRSLPSLRSIGSHLRGEAVIRRNAQNNMYRHNVDGMVVAIELETQPLRPNCVAGVEEDARRLGCCRNRIDASMVQSNLKRSGPLARKLPRVGSHWPHPHASVSVPFHRQRRLPRGVDPSILGNAIGEAACYGRAMKSAKNGSKNGATKAVRPRATPRQQAARKKYLELTGTKVSLERIAAIRAQWEG